MQFAIVDLVHTGHYTLIESLTRTLLSSPGHSVTIYIQPKGVLILDFLRQRYANRVEIRRVDKDRTSITSTFRSIANGSFTQIFITTLQIHVTSHKVLLMNTIVTVFIHNIDDWFPNTFPYRWRRFAHSLHSLGQIPPSQWPLEVARAIYHHFWVAFQRKRLIETLLRSKSRIAVLSEPLQQHISKFVQLDRTIVIPFATYDAQYDRQNHQLSAKIRVCVPGFVSQTRRDYFSLLDQIEKNHALLSRGFVFDFLGGIDPNDTSSNLIIHRIRRLATLGVECLYYEKALVETQEFDYNCSLCDIILGNTNIQVDKYSVYGKTKESGIPFAMIKFAKPGILPHGYNTIPVLTSSTILFESYEQLGYLLTHLTWEKLHELRVRAKENAIHFSPEAIFKKILA